MNAWTGLKHVQLLRGYRWSQHSLRVSLINTGIDDELMSVWMQSVSVCSHTLLFILGSLYQTQKNIKLFFFQRIFNFIKMLWYYFNSQTAWNICTCENPSVINSGRLLYEINKNDWMLMNPIVIDTQQIIEIQQEFRLNLHRDVKLTHIMRGLALCCV